MTRPTAVSLEVGAKKVFATAVDWPGWCRAGKTEELALEALAAYAQRYAEVADLAGIRFPRSAGAAFDVVDRVKGRASTDFGVPAEVTPGDAERLTPARATRQATLVGAAWEVFDRIAAETPEELAKGPRGGGRDRDKMIDHVLSAEAAYARKLGLRHRPPALGDTAAIKAVREDILAVLSRAGGGAPPVPKGWPPRYAARRIAWHVLDHAWEMQDRTAR
jgi:hypothetical protein